jgi:hypothetical protein
MTTYYHGSHSPIEPGTVMTGRGVRYESQWTDADFFWALEIHRPEGCLAHRDAVFMVDNVEDIDNAGGCTDFCLEVMPEEPVSRHDLNWSTEISCLISDGHAPRSEAVREAALNYWKGLPHPEREPVWECLARKVTVLKCEALDADPGLAGVLLNC